MKVPAAGKEILNPFVVNKHMRRVDWYRQGRLGCRLKMAMLPTGEAPFRGMNSTPFHTLREAQLIKMKTTKHAVAHVNSDWGFI